MTERAESIDDRKLRLARAVHATMEEHEPGMPFALVVVLEPGTVRGVFVAANTSTAGRSRMLLEHGALAVMARADAARCATCGEQLEHHAPDCIERGKPTGA